MIATEEECVSARKEVNTSSYRHHFVQLDGIVAIQRENLRIFEMNLPYTSTVKISPLLRQSASNYTLNNALSNNV